MAKTWLKSKQNTKEKWKELEEMRGKQKIATIKKTKKKYFGALKNMNDTEKR